MEQLLTTNEAAERLRIHPNTLSKMAREGQINARYLGRGWKFSPNVVEEVLRSKTNSDQEKDDDDV